jgi:hypothetical protein
MHPSALPAAVASTLLLASCGSTVTELTSSSGSTGTTSASSATSTSSSSSSTSTSTTSGSGAPCPDPFPGVLASCSTPGQVCTVPLSCCNAQVTCTDGQWAHPTAPLCHEACTEPCDGNAMATGAHDFACEMGTLCVVDVKALSPIETLATYQCAADPCPGGALACSCAAALCGSDTCAATTEPSTVTCHPQ